MNEDEYNAMLRDAIRERLLSEVKKPRDYEKIVNNVYGGDVSSAKNQGLGGGVMADMNPDDRDYFVDITREDLPDLNPLTGKPKGWHKKVKRYTQPRGHSEPDGDEKKK
jgi:hypothetical protein